MDAGQGKVGERAVFKAVIRPERVGEGTGVTCVIAGDAPVMNLYISAKADG